MFVRITGEFVKICLFAWERACTNYLDESIIVDKDAIRVQIPYLLVILFEFRASSYHCIEQVPQFSLKKVPSDSSSVLDFSLKDMRVMRIL